MRAFNFEQLPMRVVFAAGAVASIGDEVRRCPTTRAMVLHGATARDVADDVARQLGSSMALRWNDVAAHVPLALAERARDAATKAEIDLVICIGGGSAIGLAKAIALTHRVPILAVPTTYAGSEQTAIYGITDAGRKRTGKDSAVLPRVVVYDPELTTGLSPSVTGASAFNALAHSVEGLYAPGCNPITSTLALEAIGVIAASLPAGVAAPHDIDLRGDLLYGAALSGMVLGATSAGLHHKICHVLGGMLQLVHADAHSVLLPHVVAFNASALPHEMARLAAALGSPGSDPAALLHDLAVASGVPTRLADLSGVNGPVQRADLAAVAEHVAHEVVSNPRPVDAGELLKLLQDAFDGFLRTPRRTG